MGRDKPGHDEVVHSATGTPHETLVRFAAQALKGLE
jgi:hypothetical protein